jgi:hypothetical protein
MVWLGQKVSYLSKGRWGLGVAIFIYTYQPVEKESAGNCFCKRFYGQTLQLLPPLSRFAIPL